MKGIGWLTSGMVLGLVGSAVWAAIVYFAGWELGIVAWGIGVMAGIGVRATAQEHRGPAPALVAVVCAIACIGIAKVGSIGLFLYGSGAPSDEDAIVAISDIIVRDYERGGYNVDWPGSYNVETAHKEAHYPVEIWSEAARRWQAIDFDDQQRYLTSFMHLTLLDTEYVVTFIADQIIEDRVMRGDVVGLTRGGITGDDYDPYIWNEAVDQWNALDAEQRISMERYVLSQQGVSPDGDLSSQVLAAAVLATLSPWDLIWLALAAVSAWRIGYGGESVDGAVGQDAAMMDMAHVGTGGASVAIDGGAVHLPSGAAATPQEQDPDAAPPLFDAGEGDNSFFRGRRAS